MNTLHIPPLEPKSRDREYRQVREELRDHVVYSYLFEGLSHRQLDESILRQSSDYSRGYFSMGILHHFGLVGSHKGLFGSISVAEALEILEQAGDDFARVAEAVERHAAVRTRSSNTNVSRGNADAGQGLQVKLKSIQSAHVYSALSEIDRDGIPNNRQSTKYSLRLNGRLYPPKYVLSLAHKYATGMELPASEFSGGEQTNEILQGLGFEIIETEGLRKSFSWTIVSPTVALKNLDKSAFEHNSTGIPTDIRDFFGIEDIHYGELFPVVLEQGNSQYDAHIELTAAGRTRMMWSANFGDYLRNQVPNYQRYISTDESPSVNAPKLRLKKMASSENHFFVSVVSGNESFAEPSQDDFISDDFANEIENFDLSVTDKERLVKLRVGQSAFKSKLLKASSKCAVCGVSDERFLIASHIKPWAKSSNYERLDSNNGLLLCPNHDSLFDKGFITFDDNGKIMISSKLNGSTLVFLNVTDGMEVKVDDKKSHYLKWHREHRYLH